MNENSKFAIIKINGKQYKVSESQEILVDKVSYDNLDSKVLLYCENGKVDIGKPFLNNAKVVLEILKEDEKGEKLTVFKYKSKSRYRKKAGFRPSYTRLRVVKITL